MRFDLYGLIFETAELVFCLESPWRCSALENRLFEAIRAIATGDVETTNDQHRLAVTDEDEAKRLLQRLEGALKGWQEEADPGSERRGWFWMVESDIDSNGYDHTGEPAHVWAFLRLVLEQGGLGEPPKHDHIDCDGFGIEIHRAYD